MEGPILTPIISINGQHYASYQYLMNWADSTTFVQQLMDGTITNYSISGLFQNDNDYVVGIDFYPFDVAHFFGSLIPATVNVVIGKKSTSFTAHDAGSVANALKIFSISISRQFNNFLDFAPYTKMKIYIPFFRMFEIDPVVVYGNKLNGYLSIDSRTGSGTFFLYVEKGTGGDMQEILLDSRSAKLSISLPLGKTNEQEQARNNALTAIKGMFGILSTVGQAYSGEGSVIKSGLGVSEGFITETLRNNVDRLTGYDGGTGGRDGMSVDRNIRLIIERVKDPIAPNLHIKGGMCGDYFDLDNLSGYTEVGEIHFNTYNSPILADEVSEIVSLLKNGVIL